MPEPTNKTLLTSKTDTECSILYTPNPDCFSHITREQLQTVIYGAWPKNQSGVANIPFSFSMPYFYTGLWVMLGLLRNLIYPLHPQWEKQIPYQESVRAALNNLAKASNGTINFIETNNVYPGAPGIYFYLADQQVMSDKLNAGAFTIRKIDNNGKIQQALIFYPNNEQAWQDIYQHTVVNICDIYRNLTDSSLLDYYVNMAHHEIEHALGINHLYQFNEALAETNEGLFCSIMADENAIFSEKSICNATSSGKFACHPSSAVFPSQLDKEVLKMAYVEDLISSDSRVLDYIHNISESAASSYIISGSHQMMFGFLSNFAIQRNKPILTPLSANLIADISTVLALAFWLEFPAWAIGMYGVTSGTKFLPPPLLDKLPSKIKSLVTSNYNNYLINLTGGYLKGQQILPLLGTLAASAAGSWMGGKVGYKLGQGCAWIPSKIIQTILAKGYKQDESSRVEISIADTKSESITQAPEIQKFSKSEEEFEIENSDDYDDDEPSESAKVNQSTVSNNIYNFFQRSYTNTMNYFKGNKTSYQPLSTNDQNDLQQNSLK